MPVPEEKVCLHISLNRGFRRSFRKSLQQILAGVRRNFVDQPAGVFVELVFNLWKMQRPIRQYSFQTFFYAVSGRRLLLHVFLPQLRQMIDNIGVPGYQFRQILTWEISAQKAIPGVMLLTTGIYFAFS